MEDESEDESINLDRYAWFGDVLVRVRDEMNGGGHDAKTITESLVAENPTWSAVVLNAEVNNDFENQVFAALLSSPQMKSILFHQVLEEVSVEVMLRKAVPLMPNLDEVTFGRTIIGAEAESIFSILRTSPSLKELCLYIGSTSVGLTTPLTKFLRESTSLWSLQLLWKISNDDVHPMMAATMCPLCEAIGQASSSLECLYMFGTPPPDGGESIATIVANAIVSSPSICYFETNVGLDFARSVDNALKKTRPVQNFELAFRLSERNGGKHQKLEIFEIVAWRKVLSQNVPLGLWSHILSRTKKSKMTSHSPQDILFFLLKEKNDVLLQNVRRRKIRKRKRFQISS